MKKAPNTAKRHIVPPKVKTTEEDKETQIFKLKPVKSLLLTLSLTLSRVTTFPTGGFLQMVRLGPTSTTQGVRLISPLTK